MDDTAKLALIRAVLATFNANSEDDSGDRRLSSPGECIEAITAIADEANTEPGYTAMRDGWITPADISAILADQENAATALEPGRWRVETGLDLAGQLIPGRLECVPCTWYGQEIAAGHDTTAGGVWAAADLADLITATGAHHCPARVTTAWKEAHPADGH